MDLFLEAAIEEARLGLREGGIPIGSVLRSRRGNCWPWPQSSRATGSAILHAEMDCIESAGRLRRVSTGALSCTRLFRHVICAAERFCSIGFRRSLLVRIRRSGAGGLLAISGRCGEYCQQSGMHQSHACVC